MRETHYVVGGYVVHGEKVLLLWHPLLERWVPSGGRVEVSLGEYPHEAVIREVEEETSLCVVLVSPQGIDDVADAAVKPQPRPFAVQEILVSGASTYLDFVYFCRSSQDKVSLDYTESRAYHWFSLLDLDTYPLLPHVRLYSRYAISELGRSAP